MTENTPTLPLPIAALTCVDHLHWITERLTCVNWLFLDSSTAGLPPDSSISATLQSITDDLLKIKGDLDDARQAHQEPPITPPLKTPEDITRCFMDFCAKEAQPHLILGELSLIKSRLEALEQRQESAP